MGVRFITHITRLEITAGLPHFYLCPVTDREPGTEKAEASVEADALWAITKCKPERETSPLP